jgi:hypothetical protein
VRRGVCTLVVSLAVAGTHAGAATAATAATEARVSQDATATPEARVPPDAAAAAGEAAPSTGPRTGDPRHDHRLADVDLYAARWPQAFVDELVRYFDAPRALVEPLLDDPAWTAADLWQACALAHVTGRPCRAVVEAWPAARAAGWGALGTRLGAPPGSERARRIAAALEASYARWGRPLPAEPDAR